MLVLTDTLQQDIYIHCLHMGGVHIERGGYITNGQTFAESLMVERDIEWIVRAHKKKSKLERSMTKLWMARSMC